MNKLDQTRNCRISSERRYSDKHEWASREGNSVKVGVSQYAQEALGDVVFVQLPDVGAEVTKDGNNQVPTILGHDYLIYNQHFSH